MVPKTYFTVDGKLQKIIRNYYTTKKGYRGVQVIVLLEDCSIQDYGENNDSEGDVQQAKHLALEIINSEIEYWGGLEEFEKGLWWHEKSDEWSLWYHCHVESVEYNGKWFTKAVCDNAETLSC